MKIKIKKLYPDVILPDYAHPGDAGMDLYSRENKELKPGERHNFLLGFALEFDRSYAAIVKDKGSLSHGYGLHTIAGVFDAGYRGEYNVELINLGNDSYKISQGDKITQLVILPVVIAELEEVAELSESARGKGRFGSTGK
ncbi:dUTP diphosphatase [Patescibacteria group bacterium]|nr:dUTP diphosphatase [Patescibacteria group bacterium]